MTTADVARWLTRIERRRRWKGGLQLVGILLAITGVMFLPIRLDSDYDRYRSTFSAVRDLGVFARWGVGCIAAGLFALAASLAIRGEGAE